MSTAATPQIYAKMNAVMRDIGAISKSHNNSSQGYKFRGIDDMLKAVQPLFVAHGVLCIPSVIERERDYVETRNGGKMASVRLLVRHTFYCIADGSSVECVTLGEAMDSGDKASNKAMSTALKYALIESFVVPVDEPDRDTEEHSPEYAPAKGKTKAAPSGDAMSRERDAVSIAIEAATTEAEVNALRPRVAAFAQGTPERTKLSALATARLAALKAGMP